MKLELCSGNNPKDGYIHVDRDPKSPHVEYVIDLMALISVDIPKEAYPDAMELENISDVYNEILIQHGLEHIPWIYHEALFSLIYRWLEPGGVLIIETPDLDYILKSVEKNRKKHRYPPSEHPNLIEQNFLNFWKWVNFKLFSGGSKGDYHLSLYNKEFLSASLTTKEHPFIIVTASTKHGTLYIKARKKKAVKDNETYYKPRRGRGG